MKKLAKDERETIISRTELDDGWHIYSSSPKMMRIVKRICGRLGLEVVEAPDMLSLEAELPLECVSVKGIRKRSNKHV